MERLKHRVFFNTEIRAAAEPEEEGQLPKLAGHAIVADTKAEGWGWTEEVDREAITKALKRKPKVASLWNHKTDFPLGKTANALPEDHDKKTGLLKLKQDDLGLNTETIPSLTSYARDLVENVRSGVVSQMSFGFYILDEEMIKSKKDDELPHFIIRDFDLFDVSFVTFPFYKETDAELKKRFSNSEERLRTRLEAHGAKIENTPAALRAAQIRENYLYINGLHLRRF